MVHGPRQMLLSRNVQLISFKYNESYGGNLYIQISKAEILIRRNKPKAHCVTELNNWDNMVISKHTKDIGCVPQYLPDEFHGTFPICKTKNETKRWNHLRDSVLNDEYLLPCHQMPRIDYGIQHAPYDKKGTFSITVGYPEEVKIITQSRAVNTDTLIGNIGGYIGLFLGKSNDSAI